MNCVRTCGTIATFALLSDGHLKRSIYAARLRLFPQEENHEETEQSGAEFVCRLLRWQLPPGRNSRDRCRWWQPHRQLAERLRSTSGRTAPTNSAGVMPTGRPPRPPRAATAPWSAAAGSRCPPPPPAPAAAACPRPGRRPPAGPCLGQPGRRHPADAFFDFDKSVLKPEGKARARRPVGKLSGINLEVVIAVGPYRLDRHRRLQPEAVRAPR